MAPTEDTSQPSPGDHPASKEEYDGVLSDDINTSAWSAMSSIIHEVDERKIKGYKEDIDTFLVFAGLFSAVLSAFLVESYQGLQQDPMEVMVALMQQVALQTYSYSLNAGFLNSTVPPLSQQTLFAFQPSVNAVRVNVLWFASLTLSLISASFGILVKQWLREYLAGDYTSPQARLRVRHYRNPGLDNWKVFEIAAILPLLLQLSLALFFIGLCIFTADVHSTIGHTTLPLVAAWGFLFVASAIAPAFSPRCPYKTTLFKSITRIIWKQQLSLVHCLRTAYSRLNLGLRAPNTRAARHSPGSHVQILIPGKWPYEDPAYDEEVAAKTDVNDLDILLTVDSIQSDDDLLRTMMNTLQQSQVARTEYVRFALAIISHRLQIDVIPSSGFLDLLRLPRQVASTIMPPISEILRREINRQLHAGDMRTVEWHDWMKDCLFILFAKTSIAMPAQADLLFLSLLTDQSRCTTFFNMIQIRAPDVDAVPHILERLQGTLNAMNGGDVLLVLYHLVQEYFSPESPANYQTFLDTLKNSQKVPLEILQLFVDTLVIRVGIELSEPRWEPYILAKISLIIELSSKISCRDGVLSLFQTLLSWNSNFTGLGRYAMGLNRSTDSTSLKEGAQSMFIDVILAASRISELHKILETFSYVLDNQWKQNPELFDTTEYYRQQRLDPLKSCLILLRALRAMQEQSLSVDDHVVLIRDICTAIEYALPLVESRRIQGHRDMAKDCLKLIDTLDFSQRPHDLDTLAHRSWARDFHESASLFPDALIEGLKLFLASDEDTTFSHRLRRLAIAEEDDSTSLSFFSAPLSSSPTRSDTPPPGS